MQLTAKVDVNVDGLLSLKADVSDAALDAAQAGADVLVQEARAVVPVLSGELQHSITAETVEQSESRVVIEVAPHEPYAGVIENAQDHSPRARKQHPNPFMQIALDNARESVRQAIIDALKARLHR